MEIVTPERSQARKSFQLAFLPPDLFPPMKVQIPLGIAIMIMMTTPRRKYLAFDIETARITENEPDWRSCRPLGISCAATLTTNDDQPTLWHGGDARVQETG